MGKRRGEPQVFWTKKEREILMDGLEEIARKLPRRTHRAIISMMLRLESENEA